METTRHSISLNAQPKTQAEALADLPVTAEQAQPIAGGTDVIVDVIVSAGPGGGGHVKVFNGATGTGYVPSSGGQLNNHNETVEYDETDLDELGDLLLTNTQEDEIKTGGGDYQTVVFVGGWGASSYPNHNETVSADEATTSEELADLLVEDAEQIKGGPSGLSAGKVSYSDLSVML